MDFVFTWICDSLSSSSDFKNLHVKERERIESCFIKKQYLLHLSHTHIWKTTTVRWVQIILTSFQFEVFWRKCFFFF
jgi:hypothetical protein